MRFGLLGPPVLFHDGQDGSRREATAVASPKSRALLVALLLDAGRVVSVEALKDVLWSEAPPVSAQASLHNHIARLRRLLDDPRRLRTVPSGYVLRLDEGELDVHVFDGHVAAARTAHAGRDWERVVRESAAALALWRGAPLAGLPPEVGGYAFAQRLCEARLLLLEWRHDAELALGGPRLQELVPELVALTGAYPLREVYHRQLMLALHRTGRPAEALAVHRDLRARLVGQLGIEPGAGVREAHLEVLRGALGDAGAGEGPGDGEGLPPGRAGGAFTGPADGGSSGTLRGGSADQAGGGPPRPVGSSSTGPADSASTGPADGVPIRPADGVPTRPAGGVPTGPADGVPTGPAGSSSTSAADVMPTRSLKAVRRLSHSETSVTTPVPAPAQLPPPPSPFIGRDTVRDALHRVLTAPAAHRVAVISGMAGVGKSALALCVGHQLAERFPDGQLHLDLHGTTPGMAPLTPAQALTSLLRDLGVEPCRIPEQPDAAAALLRSLLAPARTLLVLDDAASAAQVRPLLPGGAGCAVIVTSRSPLTALDGAARFPLAPLSDEESAELLRSASGREGLDGTDAARLLVALTGRLPLALRVVAARLAARRALTPETLAGQLAAAEGRLRHLEYDDLSVGRSLAVAYDALAGSEREADRDAARTLRAIGALDLPTYGARLLARLTGLGEPRTEAALDRLLDVALLEETTYGRYAPHGLVRDVARERAGEHGALATADAGAVDLADTALHWYAAVAERVLGAIVEPGLDREDRLRPTASQPTGHAAHVATVTPFAGPEEAFAWADGELENVVALVERHADAPSERRAGLVCALVRLISPYAHRRGRLAEMEVLGQAGLRVARRLGDTAAEAYALVDLGGLHFLTGRHSDALALNDRALTLWRRLGHTSWIRRCLNNRGLLLDGLGRRTEAGEALTRSLQYARRLNDPYGEAITHSHLGNLVEPTDPRAAIEQHRRSLALGDEIGAVIVRHAAHRNIGYAHLRLGQPADAVPHFEESLRILGGHGDWYGESRTRLGLVRALRLLGCGRRAARECAELLGRAEARDDRHTAGLARHQHGLLLRERGAAGAAHEEWDSALAALEGTDEWAVITELRQLLASPDRSVGD
ncbi:BTAD domain-containing putative transcriptional regulator [Streptomyces sp. NPDC059696]|uniref:AfsR/SARP family transcriptional regulator n=1 Tax=Streptomyces sp. NPDC059696 TaxID=3346911 RepID=UPI0036A790E4